MDFWAWQRGEVAAAIATLADAAYTYAAIRSGRAKEVGLSRVFSTQPWAPAVLMIVAHVALRWVAWDGFWPATAQGSAWMVVATLHVAAVAWGIRAMSRRR